MLPELIKIFEIDEETFSIACGSGLTKSMREARHLSGQPLMALT